MDSPPDFVSFRFVPFLLLLFLSCTHTVFLVGSKKMQAAGYYHAAATRAPGPYRSFVPLLPLLLPFHLNHSTQLQHLDGRPYPCPPSLQDHRSDRARQPRRSNRLRRLFPLLLPRLSLFLHPARFNLHPKLARQGLWNVLGVRL